uniref:Putative SPX domain-containing protein 1 n=1 Tax=Davidia involucrata TaxID=16924 RepID=A0A5B7BJU0_DAVIN
MKFGKSLRSQIAESLPEWEGEFMSYKELKKRVNQIAPWHEETKRCRKRPRLTTRNMLCTGGRNMNIMRGGIGFIQLLDSKLEKVNAFFFEKEEEYIIRMKELKDRVANVECSGDMMQVSKDILDFHREIVLLLHYSVLNFTGLMKIIKKHNKKTGSFIHLPSVPRVLQQPFFTTDLIRELLKECDAMLNQLFLVNKP